MCGRCEGVLAREFPKLRGGPLLEHLLWGMTAFPCADAETFERQIIELAQKIRPRKRGWIRRFHREAERIERETSVALEAKKSYD